MAEKIFPKFIKIIPQGIDKFEGGSANRVADAITNHIKDYNLEDGIPKIIGIDGVWGSGKSNLISILKTKLEKAYHIFEYDAWGHQEDLQRRSFIENLTTDLLNSNLLKGQTTIKIKNGETKKGDWNEKLKFLLARKFESNSITYPKIGYGIIVGFFTIISMPITFFIAKLFEDKLLSVFIVSTPILISLLIWLYASHKNKNYKNFDFLFAIYQDKVKEDVKFETISEEEPSVNDFRNWMKDVSKSLDKNKKLIIVFDNMDRLPSIKVKELWSSIHTFFADNNGYENIWVIIPFDKEHLANAFGENNENNKELIIHFINKTFPVIYRIPPPVLTDWKKIFNDFFEEGFSNSEEPTSKESIIRIYSIIKNEITPREIIVFINEMVTLKKMWGNEIPLINIAIFCLLKDEILKDKVNMILSGKYLKNINKIVTNTEEFQGYMATLVYGINSENAKQIPLTQFLKETLTSIGNHDINLHSENKHFIHILDSVIRDIDIAYLDKVISNLDKLDSSKINIQAQWNQLVKIQIEEPLNSINIEETHKILFKNSDKEHNEILAKYLTEGIRNFAEIKGDEYFNSMKILSIICTENNIELKKILKIKIVKPEVFIDYVTQAKNEYIEFNLKCDNKELNDFLNIKQLPNMDWISYLIDDKNYSFDIFSKDIEAAIENDEINLTNYSETIKAYKYISKTKPLNKLFNNSIIQNIYNQETDKESYGYYDIIAMVLCEQLINVPYEQDLEIIISERLEFYTTFEKLLIKCKDSNNELLKKAVKKIVENKDDKSIIDIENILPFYETIRNSIDVSDETFLNRLNDLQKIKDKEVNITDIELIIPDFNFYKISSIILNDLTNSINKIAIEKLKNISSLDLDSSKNSPSYYWTNCASILIKNNVLENIPENLIDLSKKLLVDISEKKEPIPNPESSLDLILNAVDKSRLQPTIKSICDTFCNNTITITPNLFIYYVEKFDFINLMKSREGDIARNILSVVIEDDKCLEIILENSSDYIKLINVAGADAEDLKGKIKNINKTNTNEILNNFALSIGISLEDNNN